MLTFGRYADDNFGGLERYVFELARVLEDQVRYTNIVAERGDAPDLQMVGETVHAPTWASIAGTPVCPTMPWNALTRHRQVPFDLVHLQFPADPMAHLSTALLPRSVKRVISWHSDIIRQQKLLALYRPFLDRLVRSADAIIAATPAHISSSQQLDAVPDRSRLHVVPYGFDLSRFRERPALANEVRRRFKEGFLVFALGRHVYYKGFEFLIRAMGELPGSALALGGQGPLSGHLEQVARHAGVTDRVRFVGRIAEAELPAWYHACDVFCLPSVEPAEGFGIVQIEAMASGKPVVCCDLGNGVNYVNRHGETGLAVPPRDVATLAAVLNRLRGDPALRARLGEQGRRRAFGEFTLEKMRDGTMAVYRQVLAQSRL